MDIEKEIRRKRRWRIVIGLAVLFVLVTLPVLPFLAFSAWFGDTRMGAKIRLNNAMKRKDGKSAVFYGERLVKKYTNRNGEIEYTDVVVRLAKAYELDGQHQKAQEMYDLYQKLREKK